MFTLKTVDDGLNSPATMIGDLRSDLFDSRTICAESTPRGRGAVSIIRLSGADAFAIASSILRISFERPDMGQVAKVRLGTLRDPDDETIIDEALILGFKAPSSFTGEDVIEFHVHGSPLVVSRVLKVCVRLGCCPAEPGEFTRRAVLNGKLSVSQALAVGSLIDSTSEVGRKVAATGLKDRFSSEVMDLRQKLLSLSGSLMAAVDFPEEGVSGEASEKIRRDTHALLESLKKIRRRSSLREKATQAHRVILIGKPNAGKSSLFNALLSEDRAIVTSIPGTTRDFLSETRVVHDMALTFVDTAGVRDSSVDPIEIAGMKRALAEVQQGDLILYCFDGEVGLTSEEVAFLLTLQGQRPCVLVRTKKDLVSKTDEFVVPSSLQGSLKCFHDVSTKTPESTESIDSLLVSLTDILKQEEALGEASFLVTRSQLALLADAEEQLKCFSEKVNECAGEEFLVEDLRELVEKLDLCVGAINREDILTEVFENFCLGK